MEAKTAKGERENTFVKVALSMGEVGIAGAAPATNKIPIEKKEEKTTHHQ